MRFNYSLGSSSWRIVLAFLGLVAAQPELATSPEHFPSPFGVGGSGWDDAYVKAAEFVKELTLVEKVNLTTGTGWSSDLCVGMTGSVPRLGFRGLCLQDGPLGVRFTDLNTAFPAGINAAATWSRDLIYRRGEAMGAEFRDKGVDVQLGPAVGPLGRLPAGGRNWEGFGPDPYLAGVAMAETVSGIQSAGVVACAKHYILNEQEHYRGSISSNIGDRDMHEVYLWPFADAIRAGAGSVMCSYNRINNTYACENSWILNHLLKDELDFQGFVMSDWGAQHSGVISALSGLDMTMPGDGVRGGEYNSLWGGALTEAVLNGTVPMWRLDDMVMRIMASYFKVGRDETRVDINFSSWTTEDVGPLHPSSSQSPNVTVNQHIDAQADHADLVREIGAKSMVLLKNVDGALPLRSPGSMAVIGEDAGDNPDGPNSCSDRGCNNGTLAMGWGSGTANFPYLIAPATALEKQAEEDETSFTNVKGNFDLEAAMEAAVEVDVALVFANANAGEGYLVIDGNEGDRTNLTLWKGGDELIRAVASVNPNTIIVLHTVGPVLIEEYKAHPNITAIVWAGLPGQESGNSLVDILYGKVNPQAKSVFTWGKEVEDWGIDILQDAERGTVPQDMFSEGTLIDYRWFDAAEIEPSYEFGFGMSYTTFEYSNLTIAVVGDINDYTPTSLTRGTPPTYGNTFSTLEDSVMPEDFEPITPYVYPWANADAVLDGTFPDFLPENSTSEHAQEVHPAGGGPGGNPGLYNIVLEVSATITNVGELDGTEIAQLYVNLGPYNPLRALRGFEEVVLEAGESKIATFQLTYRDIAMWDEDTENWVLTLHDKTIYVGSSSRDLPLAAKVAVES